MAKEAEKKEEEKEEETPSKGFPLKWVIMAVVGLIVLGGGLFAAKIFFLTPGSEIEQEETPPKEDKLDVIGAIYSMDTFIVNLADNSGERYLKITLELELSKDEVKEEIEKRIPQLRDAILMVLTSKRFEDINSIAGKNLMRNEIIIRINRLLTTGNVKKIYFVEFVVQ